MRSFVDLARAGFLRDLLPIIPPDAPISARSKAVKSVTAGRGKLPGRRLSDGWVGFPNWTAHEASAGDMQTWSGWGAGIGLASRRYPAFDIDVSNASVAGALEALVTARVGLAPKRVGRAPRALLACRAADGVRLIKRRIAFTLDGSPEVQAIELLADGQQYVVEGIHPRTQKPYLWHRPLGRAQDMPALTQAAVDAVFDEAGALIEFLGGTILKASAAPVVTAQDALLAPSPAALVEALASIPNDVDYDTWISIGVAIKAASGGSAEGAALWRAWTDACVRIEGGPADEKWESFRPPFRLGWDFISRKAGEYGFSGAGFEFGEVEAEETKETPEGVLDTLFAKYVWVEEVERAYDVTTRESLNRSQFNVANNHVGPPHATGQCAWAQWLADDDRLRRAKSFTYRPGKAAILKERGRDCVNTWRPPELVPVEGDVTVWLEHLAYLLPSPTEHEAVLDWMAFVLQRPDEKPRWAIVLGGDEGIGKDMLFQPLIEALGHHNTSTISPDTLASTYTDWFDGKRLIIVEEMMNFEKRAAANKLKPYVAAPPMYVEIQKKYVARYEVPNIAAFVFFTNFENALAVSARDRRYHVLWSDAAPRDETHYAALADWYETGGYANVAAWLLKRDLTNLLSQARAPITDAKTRMHALTLSAIEAWVAEGIEGAEGVFAADLVTLNDVQVGARAVSKDLSGEKLAMHLRRAGARAVKRVRLKNGERAQVYSLRRHEMYADLDPIKLLEMHEKQQNSEPLTNIFANA